MVGTLSKELLFETSRAALYQEDRTETFLLHFNGEDISFRVCELIVLKKKLQKVDIAAMLLSDGPDVELLYLAHCDRFFALSIHDILELKELLAGAFTMLELNSLIHREIVRKR